MVAKAADVASPPDLDRDDQRDPEALDAALTDEIAANAANEGADPASAELHEAAVAPVGVSPVDLVATPPSTGAAPAPGGPLPGRWVLTDAEILAFAFLLLAAGSGTTWKQMGITLVALLTHPEWLEAVRGDPEVLRAVIEEGARWMPTDPVFARFVARPVTLHGVDLPEGAVVHTCFAAANRDPARWDRPDIFDPGRAPPPHLAFGNGPHVCIGMHVARAEIDTAVRALITRLPNLRLDGAASPPRIIGMYERGPSAVPAVWG